MSDFELEYDLTRSDYCSARQHLGRRLAIMAPHDWKSRLLLAVVIVASGAVTLALLALWERAHRPQTGLLMLAMAGFAIMLVALNLWPRVRGRQIVDATVSDDGPILGPQRIVVEAEGLRHIQPGCESLYRWEILHDVEEAGAALLLFIDRGAPVIIPTRAFPAPDALAAFRTLVTERGRRPQKEDAAPRPAAGPTTGAQAPERAGFLAALAVNLREGLRVALLLPSGTDRWRPGPEQLIALLGLGLGSSLAADVLAFGTPGYLNWWGLPSALFYLPFLLLGAHLVARRERRPQLLIVIGTALAAAAIFIDLGRGLASAAVRLGLAGEERSRVEEYLNLSVWLWWTSVIVAGAARLSAGRLTAGLRSGLVAAAVLALPMWLLPPGPEGRLWYPQPDDTEARRHDAGSSEEAFYLQPELLARRINQLEPGRPGIADVYFIGFAGYGWQDVFAREVSVIEELFREKFDAAGRTVKLINNPRTVLREPIATRTALTRTLEHIGRIMNPDEDILVVYLTSHGSAKHRLDVSFWPWHLHEIDPQTLRRMLDEAGIKWRVIAISACYSGGFIEALKNEHTLIMTAADGESQSFGCGSESDFTYFGKALFDEELRRTHSFTQAFAAAKARIDSREHSEKKTPSNPQIFVGSAMKDKLKELDAQFAAAGKPPAAAREPVPAGRRKKIAAILDLWEIAQLQPIAYRDCFAGFEEIRPERTVGRQPDAFGGIRPGSPAWPEVIAAFDRYAKGFCAPFEPDAYRSHHAQVWDAVPEAELDLVLRSLESGAYRTALRIQNRVGRDIMAGYSKGARVAGQAAQERFDRDIELLRQSHPASDARPAP